MRSPSVRNIRLFKVTAQAGPRRVRDGAGADGRWRHKIGAADAATILSVLPTKSSPDKTSGVGPQDRRGKAPEQLLFKFQDSCLVLFQTYRTSGLS